MEKKVGTQIIHYFRTYQPKKMVLISAYPISPISEDKDEVSRLRKEGIEIISPFGPEKTPWEQERKLREIIEAL